MGRRADGSVGRQASLSKALIITSGTLLFCPQIYHQCSKRTLTQTFMCPNGTAFNEKQKLCERAQKVACVPEDNRQKTRVLLPTTEVPQVRALMGLSAGYSGWPSHFCTVEAEIRHPRHRRRLSKWQDVEEESAHGSRLYDFSVADFLTNG